MAESDWFSVGQDDYEAGKPQHFGTVRVSPLLFGKRFALSEWRAGWEAGRSRGIEQKAQVLRAALDAPLIGKIINRLSAADYETRKETALGLSAQLEADPEDHEVMAMLSGAIASTKAASGVDVESEIFRKTVALFTGDPLAEVRALDALRTYG